MANYTVTGGTWVNNRDGIYVSKLGFGEKYYFASISVPREWIGAGEVTFPVEMAALLMKWREAWLREQRERGAEPCGD